MKLIAPTAPSHSSGIANVSARIVADYGVEYVNVPLMANGVV
jgi:hypothetical protein